MPAPPAVHLPHHDHDHDHNHNHNPYLPRRPSIVPSGLHTHYFNPVPQPPAYEPFSFPMIFNDIPEDIPSIGKVFPNTPSSPRLTCSLTDFPDYEKDDISINIDDDQGIVLNGNSPPTVGKINDFDLI